MMAPNSLIAINAMHQHALDINELMLALHAVENSELWHNFWQERRPLPSFAAIEASEHDVPFPMQFIV